MIVYAAIMFLVGVLFIVFGYLIMKGTTSLINDYHQTKVKDKTGYGKAIGKAEIGIGIFAFISAIVSLIGAKNLSVFVPIGIFLAGFIVSFVFIYKAQKKYNGGMF